MATVKELREQSAQAARFEIGRHYKEQYATAPSIYTFLGKCSKHYGYFVDSLNIYHRVKIKEDERGEYANAPTKGSIYTNGAIYASNEVPEHEILSCANGTSILLNADTVIHSYEELEAALKPKHIEEEKPMKKVTVEQAVSAVQAESTQDAIEAVLMTCTKAVMAEVYKKVTGQPAASLHIKSADKKYQAETYAKKIMDYRADEAFKAKPFDEKFEMLLAAGMEHVKRHQLSLYSAKELIMTAQRLGVDPAGLEFWRIDNAIVHELQVREEISWIEHLCNEHDDDELRHTLLLISNTTLDRLLKQAGITVEAHTPYDTGFIQKADALYVYYTHLQYYLSLI